MNYLEKIKKSFESALSLQKTWPSKELAQCTFCPRLCRHVCPAAIGEFRETFTPTHKIGLLYHLAKGELSMTPEVTSAFYACTDCGACTAFCKHRAQPHLLLQKAREEAVSNGQAPEIVNELIRQFVRDGSLEGPPPELQLRNFQIGTTNTQLFLGCAASREGDELAELLLKAAQMALPMNISLTPPEFCCGQPLYALGASELHRQFIQNFSQYLQKIDLLIVADPHCAHHLQKVYPKLGIPIPKIVPLIEVLSKLKLKAGFPFSEAYYLDSTPLGRYRGLYNLPRQMLKSGKVKVLEFSRKKFLAWDSAVGGPFRYVFPKGAESYARWLMGEVVNQSLKSPRTLPPTPTEESKKELTEKNLPPVFVIGESERKFLQRAVPELKFLELQRELAQLIAKK